MTERIEGLETQVVGLKARMRLMTRGYLILLVVAIAAAGLSVRAGTSANRAIQTVATFDHDGAVQRVTTISQRCDLTAKIADVLGKDDPSRLSAFQTSYERCLIGLRKAEKLAHASR